MHRGLVGDTGDNSLGGNSRKGIYLPSSEYGLHTDFRIHRCFFSVYGILESGFKPPVTHCLDCTSGHTQIKSKKCAIALLVATVLKWGSFTFIGYKMLSVIMCANSLPIDVFFAVTSYVPFTLLYIPRLTHER
jgi:hypothetical protein